MLDFVEELGDQGIQIESIDFGGGLGVRYSDEAPPSPAEYWRVLESRLKARDCKIPVTIEPGRAIVGNAGVLLTRVNYLKRGQDSNFCVVDAGMNDLIRPALYQAHQEIVEVEKVIEVEKIVEV